MHQSIHAGYMNESIQHQLRYPRIQHQLK